MRKEGKEETMKARREICQFSKNLIKGNRDGCLREDKNLVRLLVQKNKTKNMKGSRSHIGGEIIKVQKKYNI